MKTDIRKCDQWLFHQVQSLQLSPPVFHPVFRVNLLRFVIERLESSSWFPVCFWWSEEYLNTDMLLFWTDRFYWDLVWLSNTVSVLSDVCFCRFRLFEQFQNEIWSTLLLLEKWWAVWELVWYPSSQFETSVARLSLLWLVGRLSKGLMVNILS